MGVASLPAPYAGTPLDTERRNSRGTHGGSLAMRRNAPETGNAAPPTPAARDRGRVLSVRARRARRGECAGAVDLHEITLAGV